MTSPYAVYRNTEESARILADFMKLNSHDEYTSVRFFTKNAFPWSPYRKVNSGELGKAEFVDEGRGVIELKDGDIVALLGNHMTFIPYQAGNRMFAAGILDLKTPADASAGLTVDFIERIMFKDFDATKVTSAQMGIHKIHIVRKGFHGSPVRRVSLLGMTSGHTKYDLDIDKENIDSKPVFSAWVEHVAPDSSDNKIERAPEGLDAAGITAWLNGK